MNTGIRTVVYPVRDIDKAKAFFRELLGKEPYTDNPYYVGFRFGKQDVGLDPNGHKEGTTVYYHVDDIRKSLQSLVEAGAQIIQEGKDIGEGGLIASIQDVDGNLIGLVQQS